MSIFDQVKLVEEFNTDKSDENVTDPDYISLTDNTAFM